MRLQLTAARLRHQLARWSRARQRDDGAALGLTQAWLAPAAGLHAQPVEPPLVEGEQALAHGLGVAVQFLRNEASAQPIPTARDHLGMQDPIGGGMATAD